MKNVVDSSGWLEYVAGGPNADVFAPAIAALEDLVVPTLTVYEVYRRIVQQRSEDDAIRTIAYMTQGELVDLDAGLALEAARLGLAERLAMADAIMLATARSRGATLWTQDADFAGVAGVEYVVKR